MDKDGLNPNNMKHKVRAFSLPGGYRKIIEFAKNLEWKIVPYNDPNAPLVRTDLAILNNEPELQYLNEGSHRALLLSFTLSSSCYATMCFRELFKMSTSLFAQNHSANSSHPKDESSTNDQVEI